ncbi:MAG: efflux RND transporter periplasmic adaptor subunit [Gammaproteobacteria bacterium]|nr:efflux RND transporter periplasmic adaptor subunit [Gammaproteobacteria bacterium]
MAADDLVFPCLIEPHVVVDISTAVEGILSDVKVRKGDSVRKGDVIATLHAEVEKAMLEHARARVVMDAALRAREVSLVRHRDKHRRSIKLSSQKFVSPDELAEFELAVDLASMELERERENRQLLELELKRMEAAYEEHFVRSPIDGVVVVRYLNPGEFAQAQPIVRIAQLDPLNVEAVLPANAHGRVREGMQGSVAVDAPLNRILEAPVTIVEKVIDAASGTFGVRIELPNPDYGIPAGLECTVRF